MLPAVMTAIATPFRPDGSLDLDGFRRLCLHLVENGSDGIVVAGTTGEAPTLTDEEKLELFAAAVDTVGGRATVVANTGTYSTAHSVHLTQEADALGVDAMLAVTPYYNKPPEAGLLAHFGAIAEATDRPVVIYNIPSRVVVNIPPETLGKLAAIPNVVAVKQANPDLEEARRVVEDTGLQLLAGNDDLLYPFLELGGAGGIFVFTHVVGPRVREVVDRWQAGDREGARALEPELRAVWEALAVTTNPIPLKAALALTGHDAGGLRLPLVEATEEERAAVRAGLERAGVLAVART